MTEVDVSQAAPEVAAPAKKKFNRKDYILEKKNGETIVKVPGTIDGKAYAIRYLENCTVHLFDHSAQVMVDKCKGCTFVVGPIKGSIFLRDCEDCTVHVACQQFRCRDFINSTVYLYTANDPIIEASSGLKFAPFNIGYPKLKEHAEASENTTENKWELIFDFSKKTESNFTVMDPLEFATQLLQIPDFAGPEQAELYYDFPLRYGGSLPDTLPQSTSAEESAFSIQTSAAEAQAVHDSKVQEQIAEVQQPEAAPAESNPIDAFMAPPVVEAQPPQQMAPPVTTPPMMMMQMQSQEVSNEASADDLFSNAIPSPVNVTVPSGGDAELGDYSPEEREMIRAAEEYRQKLMQDLFQKQQEEIQQKNARKMAATQALQEFKAKRQGQIDLTRQNNLQIEAGRKESQDQERNSSNKWDRICKNVDLSVQMGPGGRDLSRMKSAMLARKADMAGGAAGSAPQGNYNF